MTNKSYQDKWTRYHDKPTLDGSSSSNNGWIYTAYSRHLAPDTTDSEKLVQCYNKCVRNYLPIKIDRSPDDSTPPLSKDEVIGMVSLGFLNDKELEASHWNFCNLEYVPEKLTISAAYKAAKVLYKIRKEHRNYVWQNEIKEAYPLAFFLGPEDQYYVKKFYGKRATLFQFIIFYLNALSVLTYGNKSVRMMLFLKLTDLNHWLLRFVNKEKYVRNYFGEEHPFVKGLEK